LTVTGGTGPFLFTWDNGATTEDITTLTAGTYTVTVTDNNGCSVTTSANINNIGGPSLSTTQVDATCGNNNGSIDLTVTGGTGPFTYNWSNGATTEDITALVAGTYTVTATDNNGCSASASATINNIGGPSVSTTQVDATCGNSNVSRISRGPKVFVDVYISRSTHVKVPRIGICHASHAGSNVKISISRLDPRWHGV
jgi:hypothetical protein